MPKSGKLGCGSLVYFSHTCDALPSLEGDRNLEPVRFFSGVRCRSGFRSDRMRRDDDTTACDDWVESASLIWWPFVSNADSVIHSLSSGTVGKLSKSLRFCGLLAWTVQEFNIESVVQQQTFGTKVLSSNIII